MKKAGHQVTLANTGLEALAALDGASFNLVLMDMQMPEMGGAEAIAAIRDAERRHGGHLPIVALTAHALKGDRERCLDAGADGYVAKPFSPQGLFTEMESVMNIVTAMAVAAESASTASMLSAASATR